MVEWVKQSSWTVRPEKSVPFYTASTPKGAHILFTWRGKPEVMHRQAVVKTVMNVQVEQ